MEESIKIIKTTDASSSGMGHGHILNHNVQAGKCFNSFVEQQKSKGITAQGAANLRMETSDILAHCNPHDAVGNDETTHLVVGYVQSGKTMSFTGLTALAHDNGYRIVVYFAGTKLNLLKQTSERLEKDLIKSNSLGKNAYKIHKDPMVSDAEEIIGHLGMTNKPTILIPILKHYDHIRRLKEIFEEEDFKLAMAGETVMIVDDEADQASLNSYGRSNSKKANNDEDETSATYDAILKLRAILPGNTYVQYTATPQANILISMQDILSPKSHTLLTPGEGYIGGKKYFGLDVNNDLFNGDLIFPIPEEQVFHNKRNKLKKCPQTLKEALKLHILAVAIVVKWRGVDNVNYLSMMVHPDVSKKNNAKFKQWIESDLTQWRKLLAKPDGQEDKEDLLKSFEELFPKAVEFYSPNERPAFKDIKRYLKDILNDKKVYLVNSDKDADTEIDWDKYCMHVLVGAEMLNRGFTVENLATTYMPRYTVGVTNADTIQQRCRFFGYKEKYIRSCRVFLPQCSIDNYREYVAHEEELRLILSQCDTLEAAERQIMLKPNLNPTRLNVLPISVVDTKLRGNRQMQAFESKETILHNDRVVKEFLAEHQNDFTLSYNYTTKDRTHRGLRLPTEQAIAFLSDFRFKNYPDASRKSATVRYLRYLASQEENPLQYVYFIQMAWDSAPRNRSFDFDNKRFAPNTRLFAGPSSATDSTDYPGDDKIVENDSITIQLHHVAFKGGIEPGFPATAYTLAINYPEELATNYCSNEEKNQEDDGITDGNGDL